MWDIKTPLSPELDHEKPGQSWRYQTRGIIASIKEKMYKHEGRYKNIQILFDLSWLNSKDKDITVSAYQNQFSAEEKRRITLIDYRDKLVLCGFEF